MYTFSLSAFKNAITFSHIWAYSPNLCQNAEIWKTHYFILAHTYTRTINGSIHKLRPPNLQKGEQSFDHFTWLFQNTCICLLVKCLCVWKYRKWYVGKTETYIDDVVTIDSVEICVGYMHRVFHFYFYFYF